MRWGVYGGGRERCTVTQIGRRYLGVGIVTEKCCGGRYERMSKRKGTYSGKG